MRQIYPFLLATVCSLATAVLLRPSLVEEFSAMCKPWLESDLARAVAAELNVPEGLRWAADRSWANDPTVPDTPTGPGAGEAFLSDGSGSVRAPVTVASRPERPAPAPSSPNVSVPAPSNIAPYPSTDAPSYSSTDAPSYPSTPESSPGTSLFGAPPLTDNIGQHAASPSPGYPGPQATSEVQRGQVLPPGVVQSPSQTLPPVQPSTTDPAVAGTAQPSAPYESTATPDPSVVPSPGMPPIAPPTAIPQVPGPPAVAEQPRHPAPPVVGQPRVPSVANRAPAGSPYDSPHSPPSQVAGEVITCESAQPMARVGDEFILGCDVLPLVNQAWASIPPEKLKEIPEFAVKQQRELITKQFLQQTVQTKLIFQDVKRSIPPEGLEQFLVKMRKQYDEKELPLKMKDAGVSTAREYDEYLKSFGSSLERNRQMFVETLVAQSWMHQQAVPSDDIAHPEIIAYYREHLEEFETAPRARWEQLSVLFSKHPDRQEARRLIAEMGNAVMSGAPFAEVARRRSEGLHASDGGQRDWISQGSLVSEHLDQALFGLPVGHLSPIIEDQQGYHIIRVIERQPLTRTPFVDAQVEIREKIKEQRRKDLMAEYTEKLHKQIPVWTVYDEEGEG